MFTSLIPVREVFIVNIERKYIYTAIYSYYIIVPIITIYSLENIATPNTTKHMISMENIHPGTFTTGTKNILVEVVTWLLLTLTFALSLFLSFFPSFFSLCSLLFIHFGDIQEADIFNGTIQLEWYVKIIDKII